MDFKLAKPGTRHVAVGAAARKTLIIGNILNAGVLNVTRAGGDGKVVIASNIDDSAPNHSAAALGDGASSSAIEASLHAAAFKDKMDGLVSALGVLPSGSDEATTVRRSIAALAAAV
jgi:hypothetical protein